MRCKIILNVTKLYYNIKQDLRNITIKDNEYMCHTRAYIGNVIYILSYALSSNYRTSTMMIVRKIENGKGMYKKACEYTEKGVKVCI